MFLFISCFFWLILNKFVFLGEVGKKWFTFQKQTKIAVVVEMYCFFFPFF